MSHFSICMNNDQLTFSRCEDRVEIAGGWRLYGVRQDEERMDDELQASQSIAVGFSM